MTEEQIKELKKGDVIMYKHSERDYYVYGLIEEDGSIMCEVLMGDGDSQIGETDFFYYSEPAWLDNYDGVIKAPKELANLFRKLYEKDNSYHAVMNADDERIFKQNVKIQKQNELISKIKELLINHEQVINEKYYESIQKKSLLEGYDSLPNKGRD